MKILSLKNLLTWKIKIMKNLNLLLLITSIINSIVSADYICNDNDHKPINPGCPSGQDLAS